MLVVIINFFSLNFTSIKIEGEKVSSSQNERSLKEGGEGGRWWWSETNEKEHGGGGDQNSGILS